jgi:hypothetical protein
MIMIAIGFEANDLGAHHRLRFVFQTGVLLVGEFGGYR